MSRGEGLAVALISHLPADGRLSAGETRTNQSTVAKGMVYLGFCSVCPNLWEATRQESQYSISALWTGGNRSLKKTPTTCVLL